MTSPAFVIGSIGRMQTVKDQLTLARAFVHLLARQPGARDRVRLVMIGDGPQREECRRILEEGHAADLAWLPGSRDDIPEIVRLLDLFVLPSLTEGISNTILEAMASGVAVLATRVGGNPELVSEGTTGMLVPANDPEAMAEAMSFYMTTPKVAAVQGYNGRARVEARFSLEAMTEKYLAVYDHVLGYSGNASHATMCRAARLRSE
jgi:glycosyltransferase involved in cell wall biosynthesis